IGERTAEDIKQEIGSAKQVDDIEDMEIRGRDLLTGLPKTMTITSSEITTALKDEVEKIVDAIKVTLEKTPPELSADIMDICIVLSGGGGLIKNLSAIISNETEIPVFVAENPINCVATGNRKTLEKYSTF